MRTIDLAHVGRGLREELAGYIADQEDFYAEEGVHVALRDGTIDAAYVGSTVAPEAIAAEYGWQLLAWVGDHFQIPTVGVAVDPTDIAPDDLAVQAVVRAHRRALKVIHDDPDTTIRHIRTFLGRHTIDEARAHYKTFIAPYFTTELGIPATVAAAEFYRTATR